jgi:hypothetical protein
MEDAELDILLKPASLRSKQEQLLSLPSIMNVLAFVILK